MNHALGFYVLFRYFFSFLDKRDDHEVIIERLRSIVSWLGLFGAVNLIFFFLFGVAFWVLIEYFLSFIPFLHLVLSFYLLHTTCILFASANTTNSHFTSIGQLKQIMQS